MKTTQLLFYLLFGIMSLTGFSQEKYFEKVDETKELTVVQLAESDERFSIFLSFLEASRLDTSMEYTEGYTIFMPTNEAFGDMEIEKLNKLIEPDNQVKLINFVKNYILPNKVNKFDFEDSQVIDFEGDESVKVSASNNNVYIGGAEIIQGDIEAEDGIIHVVDQLITPTPKF